MRTGLPDRLRHPGDARRRGARGARGLKPVAELAAWGLVLALAASLKIALANVLLGATFLVWVAAVVRGEARLQRAALYAPLAVWVGATLGAVAFSVERARSVTELGELLTLGLVPLAVSLLDRRRWERALVALAAVAFLSSAVALWQLASDGLSLEHRVHGLANHYMTFAGWTLAVTLLLVGDALFAPRRRRWTVPVIGLCSVALVLSLTRGAWLGLAVGVLLAALLWWPRVALPFVALALALWALFPALLSERAASIIDPAHPANLERLGMARAGLAMVAEHPLFGVGMGMVQPLYGRYQPAGPGRSRVPHLHSNLVQIAAERGLIAAGAYLAILIVFLVHTTNGLIRGDPLDRPALAGALLAVVGLTVAGLFDYNWGDAEVSIVGLVALSLPFALAAEAV